MTRRDLLSAAVGFAFAVTLPFGAALAGDEAPLALQGYDPVAYFTLEGATMGDERIETEWDGARYRFASEGHLDLFRDDPDLYLPQFGNLCTMSLSRGEVVVADPEHWMIHDGRLHIFGRPIGPGLMAEDPEGIEKRARSHWAALPTPPDVAR